VATIRILTTGGSLDKRYSTSASDFLVGPPAVGDLLAAANVNLDVVVEPLLRKDSLALTDADRAFIAARVAAAPERRIIITHGTDTMVATGRALGHDAGKVIVLTGAMQPAAFRETDAPLNLGTALAAVQLLAPGIYIAMNGLVLPLERARKNHDRDQYEEKS
jgi:L-asparaginase